MAQDMSNQLVDPLYEIFVDHLHSGLYDERPVEQFVRDVVESYWRLLAGRNAFTAAMEEYVKVDLAQDVQEMLRVKIYGHYGIGEYNRIRRKKSS